MPHPYFGDLGFDICMLLNVTRRGQRFLQSANLSTCQLFLNTTGWMYPRSSATDWMYPRLSTIWWMNPRLSGIGWITFALLRLGECTLGRSRQGECTFPIQTLKCQCHERMHCTIAWFSSVNHSVQMNVNVRSHRVTTTSLSSLVSMRIPLFSLHTLWCTNLT